MRKHAFFPKLAMVNLARNAQVYLPYLLSVAGTTAAFYIVKALAETDSLPELTRYVYLSVFLSIGTFVVIVFAVIFLTYTNGFLMKRRTRELGLYHILGLGKGHLAVMLGFETLYTAIIGIGGGIALGILLQKLVTLLLYRIMNFDVYYGFYISFSAIRYTVVLFSLILLGNLLLNLVRVGRQSPVELLHGSNVGEREPKTRWITAVIGVLALGGGYGIALFVQSAMDAFAYYFLAVFLVIIGTYCLFSAVSIAVLKTLRRNKSFYYRPGPFINISGMLYRMRRNAAGLANICILSTMVLVMVSGTLSLYLSSEQTLKERFAGAYSVEVKYDPTEEPTFQSDAAETLVLTAAGSLGGSPKTVYTYHYLSFIAHRLPDGYGLYNRNRYPTLDATVYLITSADYAAIYGEPLSGEPTLTTFHFPMEDGGEQTITVSTTPVEGDGPAVGGAAINITDSVWMVVEDESALRQICDLDAVAEGGGDLMVWQGFWNITGMEETSDDAFRRTVEESASSGAAMGSWIRLEATTRSSYAEDYYALNGGFFFLGLFLGTLFMLAAVLIIYYKQVSEGYEDRERYRIMRQVGMDKALIRQSIRGQILVVFFAPLLVAAVHVAFDYRLMIRLLTLFGLHKPLVTLLCTVGVFGVFAVLYALMYLATAKTYYKIVRGKT